jgi:hypothetical protein
MNNNQVSPCENAENERKNHEKTIMNDRNGKRKQRFFLFLVSADRIKRIEESAA